MLAHPAQDIQSRCTFGLLSGIAIFMWIVLLAPTEVRAEVITLKCEMTQMIGSKGNRFPIADLPENVRSPSQIIDLDSKTVDGEPVREMKTTVDVISWKNNVQNITLNRITGIEYVVTVAGGRLTLKCQKAAKQF